MAFLCIARWYTGNKPHLLQGKVKLIKFQKAFSHCLSLIHLSWCPAFLWPHAVETEYSSSLFDPYHICPLLFRLCLLKGQVWPCEIVIKSLSTCLKNLETSQASPRCLQITYQAQFGLTDFLECAVCAKKNLLPTQNADATAHASPRVHLQPVFWSQADACEGFCWILTKDNDAGGEGCPKRVGAGASHCSGRVCTYPWDAFTKVTQAGGGEAQFLGLLQFVVPELFWLWLNSSKQKTSWPTKPTRIKRRRREIQSKWPCSKYSGQNNQQKLWKVIL